MRKERGVLLPSWGLRHRRINVLGLEARNAHQGPEPGIERGRGFVPASLGRRGPALRVYPASRKRGAVDPTRPGAGRRGPARGSGRCRSGRRRRRIARPAGAVRGGRLPGALRLGRASARPGAARSPPHWFLHARRADRPAQGSGPVDDSRRRRRGGRRRSSRGRRARLRAPMAAPGGARDMAAAPVAREF